MGPTNIFLCVTMFLTAKVDLGNCRFCSISVKTAREVPSCPTEKSRVLEASKRLKCDELALIQNCTAASKFKYHCVMNVFENATLEVCAPEWYISGYCAEFNMAGGRIQPHFTMKCIGCPARYISSDAFKYTFCYKMVRNNQEKKGAISTTARGTSTNGTSSDIIITSKSREWLTWIIVAIVLIVLLGTVVFCIIFFRKRNARARSPSTNQEEQDKPLLDVKSRGQKTVGIEITEDDPEQRRKDAEFKRKTTLQYLGLLFKRELDKLKTGTDTARNASTLIEAEVCDDNEDIESKEEQLEDLQSEQELKSVEVIKPIDEYTDLFSLLASLFKYRWKNAKEVLSHMVSFEKKHKQYFRLFKMEKYSEETLSSDFNNSMIVLKNNKKGPTLREIYAASEMLNRKILLIKYIAGNKRAILISPVILGKPDESKPIEIEIKLPFAEKPRFRCLNLAQKGIETVSEELHVINAGHDFCFDKRFRNSFDLLHGENYFCLYIAAQPNKIPTIFEIMGTLIYGESSKECDSADIIKKCLKEHHSGKDMKKVYSKFVDVQSYLSDKEMEKYDEKDQEKMQQKALEKHLLEWKSITQGDFFALSSIFGIILYMKENKREDQTTQIIQPLCSEITQTFNGFFILKRCFESHFEVDDSMTKSMSCVCELKTPKVQGKLTSAESVIRELMRKEMSSSREVCCKARSGRKTHTHLQALQKSDCCLFQRKFWKHKKKKPSEDFLLSLRVEQRVFVKILKENFRKIRQTGGSLEKALSEEIYGFENNHFIGKLRKKMNSAGEDSSLKIQKATDFVGVPIYVYKMSENYCRWIRFQPRRKRLPVKCRFYITMLLQVAGDRFDRIIPIDGCNCTLDSPETASYLDKDNAEQDELSIPKDKRHSHLIKFFNTVHEKLLSELFVDETRDSLIFPTASDESEADLILTNSYMSNRSIDPISDTSNSLCRCTSKDIFGTEKHFALIENLINQETLSREYNSYDKVEHSSNETQADVVTVITPPNFPANRLHILATIFYCSIYIIRKHTEHRAQFSVWEEFKPYSPKYASNTQSREKCNENFYFTFFYSTEGNFHRVIGINKKDICNCLMDRPKTLRKENMMTKKDRKLETSRRKLKCIKKNDRHPFKIAIPLDEFIEDEVRHVPLFSCTLEISLLSSKNMAARMIDPISDISFSLCRCLSKDIFGTEAQFELVRGLLLHEIEFNRSSYDDLINNELRVVTKDVEVSNTDPLSLCVSLISDGIQMPTLQLQTAADIFQCSIYVLEIIDNNGTYFSTWKEILPKTRKANKILEGIQRKGTYYITLYRSFTGVFHRVVPKEGICNCSPDPPKTSVKEEIQSDKSKIYLKAEQQLLKTKAILDDWLRCNTVFELLLISIIDEIEDRRKSVNIATITGSSIGVVGAVLTGIGIIGAPATGGILLGLTIAGGIISAAGAITSVGAKLTEMLLSRKKSKTISCYKIQMDVFSKQLEDNINKLRENADPDETNPEILQAVAPCFRALCTAGSVPLVVLRVLSRAVLEAEAVLVPFSFFIDVAIAILAAKNLSEGSVTSESLKLRTSKHHLRLTRQQMLAWAFGNSEEFEFPGKES